MNGNRERLGILVADDSKDDRHVVERAFKAAGIRNPLAFVTDGEALLAQLEAGAAPGGGGLPGLLLLDMKMPLMDGLEALRRIRADPRFETLPVLLLTTSQYRDDVLEGYRLGANSVITKPFSYLEFVDLATMLKRFWIEHVELPALFERG